MTTIRLTIGNSFCQISGLSKDQEKTVRMALSYVDMGSHFGGFGPQRKYLIDKKGMFASGLLPYVRKALPGVFIAIEDSRWVPQPGNLFKLRLGSLSPYKAQLEAVDAAVKKPRGCLSMVTGSGKSVTMALLVERLQLKTLIIVPNLGLKEQLRATFQELFGSLKNVTIENIDSPNLKSCTDFECLIIDEAHHSAAKTYRNLNKTAWKGIYHRYFFTGTPFRSKDSEQLLYESIAGQVIYTLTYQDAVKAGMIVPIEAYYYDVPKKSTEATTWAGVYKALVVDNEPRNALIGSFLYRLQAQNISTLCLVKEIAHGELLQDASRRGFTSIPFANGQDDGCAEFIRHFNDGGKALIATTGVAGEGTDTRPCEFVIVTGLGKSRPAFIQQIGRCLRRYPGKESGKVIIFRDLSHRWTKAHFKAQCDTLLEIYGVVPAKLSWPETL
jgi:superfamily II DNA or RNA helicase